MKVTIHSHFKDQLWQGDVPDELVDGWAEAGNANERLFRLFNRVDEGDAARLEAWGYRLPSLSVGDSVGYGGRAFRVEPVGFAEVA